MNSVILYPRFFILSYNIFYQSAGVGVGEKTLINIHYLKSSDFLN